MPPSMNSVDGQKSSYYRVRDRIAAKLQRYSDLIRRNPTALIALWDSYRQLIALDEQFSRCVHELSQMEVLMNFRESIIQPAFDLSPPPADCDIPPRPPRPVPRSAGAATHCGQKESPHSFSEEEEMEVTSSSPTSEEVTEGNRRKDAFLRWYNSLSSPPAIPVPPVTAESSESTSQTQPTPTPIVEPNTQAQTIPMTIVGSVTQAQAQATTTSPAESGTQTPAVSTSSTLQPPANLPTPASTSRALASASGIGGARLKTPSSNYKSLPPKEKWKNVSKRSASERDYYSELEDESPFILSGDKRCRVANEQLHQAAWEAPYRGKPELTLAFEARHLHDSAREWQRLANLTAMIIHEFLIKGSVSGEATCRPEVPQYLGNIMPPVTDYLPSQISEGIPDIRGLDYGYTLWVATWLMQLDMHVAYREDAPFRTSLAAQRSGTYMELFLAMGLASIDTEDIRLRSRRDCYDRCLQELVRLEKRVAINQRALERRENELRDREAELNRIDMNDPDLAALVRTSQLAIEAASYLLNTAIDGRDHLQDQGVFLNEQVQVFQREVDAESAPRRLPPPLHSASQDIPDTEATPEVVVEVNPCSPTPVTAAPPTDAIVVQAIAASPSLSWEDQVAARDSALWSQSTAEMTSTEARNYDFQAFQMIVPTTDEVPPVSEMTDEVLDMETSPDDDVSLSQEDNILTGEESQEPAFQADDLSNDGPSPGVSGPLAQLGLDENNDLLDYDEETRD